MKDMQMNMGNNAPYMLSNYAANMVAISIL